MCSLLYVNYTSINCKKKKIIKQLNRYTKLETSGIDKNSVCIYTAPKSIIFKLEKQNLFMDLNHNPKTYFSISFKNSRTLQHFRKILFKTRVDLKLYLMNKPQLTGEKSHIWKSWAFDYNWSKVSLFYT